MQKVKKYSRYILIFILALATALTCFFILSPTADAADGDYYYKITINVTNTAAGWNSSNVTLYYKSNNGTGSQGSTVITTATDIWDSEGEHVYTGTISGFPSGYTHAYSFGGGFTWRNLGYTLTIQVGASASSTLQTVYTNSYSASSSAFSAASGTFGGTSLTMSNIPYVSSATFSSLSSPVYVNTDGSSVSKTYTMSAKDQYGVAWVNAPSSCSASSSNVSVSLSGKTITATYKNSSDSKDYSTTISAAWSTANSSYSSVTKTSSTVQVYVPHTLTVDTNGGSVVNNITGKYTGDTALLTTPTRTAYDFSGWTRTSGVGSVSSNVFTFGNGNGAVQAGWTPTTYTINYAPDGGNVSQASETYNIERTSLSLPTPTRDGYTFAGWTVSNADGNWIVGEPVTNTISGKYGNITAIANWTANEYTLTYDKNDTDRIGTASCDETGKTVVFDSAVGELPVPAMTAYDFDGWYTAAEGGEEVTAATVYKTAADSTLYAHWTPSAYTVSFDVNGGDAMSDMEYNIEAGTLPAPTRDGYTFDRWQAVTVDGNWVQKETLTAGVSLTGKYGDVTLQALWTANPYTVTFDLNDADRIGAAECDTLSLAVVYDNTLGTLPVPSLTAYDFDGWYTAAEGGVQVTAETIYKTPGDTVYYAHWTPIIYTATFDPNQGQFDGLALNEAKTVSYTIEDSEFIFPDCSRVGYTFEYWITSLSADSNWAADDTYDAGETLTDPHMYGDVTFAAKWDDNSYVLTFDVEVEPDAYTQAVCDTVNMVVTYDSAVGELPVPTRDAYDFAGWFLEDGTTEITADTIWKIADNTVVQAHWTPIQYTITYNVSGGSALESTVYTIEDDLYVKEAEKTGYQFEQWVNLTVNTGSWVRGTTFAADALHIGTGNWGDITLTATYTIKYYKITWVVNGVSQTVDVMYNTAPQHADPSITDDPRYEYEFLGWDPAVALATEDITYTAQFAVTPKVYTLTWKDSDGSVLESISLAYGEAIPEREVPEKEGYTAAWKNIYTTMPAFDYEITPDYTPKQYTVTWVNDDGTVLETDTVPYDVVPSYDGSAPAKAADSKYSYTFNGWTPEVSAVKGDTTYTAQYKTTPQTYTVTWRLYGIDDTSYSDLETTSVSYGEAISYMPSIPKIPGYSASWVDVPETMPDADIVIEGHYVYGAWTVTWVLDTNSSYETTVMDGNTPVYNLGTPQKAATAEYTYTFKGWSDTADGAVLDTLPAVSGADVTYYAIYEAVPNSYVATWTADGVELQSETIAYGEKLPSVAVPEKTGYTGEWDYTEAVMPARNLTITAVYTPVPYKVTWVVGSGAVEETWAYGSTPVFSGSTDKASDNYWDYAFSGWDKEITAVTGDVVYTAVYTATARKYTVTFVADGVTVGTQEVAYNTVISLIDVPEKTGYTGVWGGVPATMPANDLTVTAIYTPKKYTVKWITPDGEITEQWAYDSTPVYSGSDPVKASTAEKEYTFTGWLPAVAPVTGDAVYTAQFSESSRKYTVTYVAGTSVVTTIEVPYGDELPSPEVPEKEGYTGSWSSEYRTMPAQDITVSAVYAARKYVVTWKVNGLTVYTATVAYGQLIPAQEVPEKAGYTGSWETEYVQMPAQNITINAVYTVNTYAINWNVANEKGSGTVTYGVDYEYVFVGDVLPDSLRVTVKGKPVTSFTYDKETGAFFLPGSSIIGDVNITEKAAEGYNNVYITISNGGSSNNAEVTQEGMAYHTQIYAPEGYLLPETVNVYLDGVLVTAGYTYNKDTGKLTINAEIMSGELEIMATCPVDPNYVPPTPEEPEDDVKHGGLFGSLLDFFLNLINFLRRIFGISA